MDKITAFQMGCDSGVASIKALKALLPDPLWGDDETEESREMRNLLLNVQETLIDVRSQIKDIPGFSFKDRPTK